MEERMKSKVFSVVICLSVLLGLLSMATPVLAADPYSGRQTWQLDSENPDTNAYVPPVALPGPFQMEKNGGPGDNGQLGQVIIYSAAESSGAPTEAIWIADQAAGADVTFSNGNWVVDLVTDSDWNTQSQNCIVEIGQWDGAFQVFSGTMTGLKFSYAYIHDNPDPALDDSLVGIVQVSYQTSAETVYSGNRLAIRIKNEDTNLTQHIIYTGEGDFASCVSSPQTDPGYPLPELATGLLLGAGVLAIGGFILIRRQKAT
jgi:hypothetical protein